MIETGSPFLVLWYFFLAFLAAVVFINLFSLLLSSGIKWRTSKLKARQLTRGRRQ